jgi:hypothetical protein
MIKKLLAIILLVTVASLSIAGCTSQQQTMQSGGNPTPEKTGAVTVSATKIGEKMVISSAARVTPLPGEKFILYNVKVKNVNEERGMVDLTFFTLFDASGSSYAIADVTTLQELNPIHHEVTSPGDMMNGTIVFQIPQDAQPTNLQYQDTITTVNEPLTMTSASASA